MRLIQPLDENVAAQYRDNLIINSRYTLHNFIFKNLYEQFSRPLNFYFLLVATLQFISVIAPVNPLSTLLPLLFAFTLTAVKEGYDDVKRHRQDFAYNNAIRTVLDVEQVAWVPRRNADIHVGDVLVLTEDEEIPCDVIVLGSTGAVYIRTDNLDGEIDLKLKERVQWTTVSSVGDVTRVSHTLCPVPTTTSVSCEPPPPSQVMAAVARLSLECPPPSAVVESFEGRADIQPQASSGGVQPPLVRVPLTHHHLLPQSCVLKNVSLIVCVAVYTGDDTKCGMNKRPAPTKWAKIDKDVSRYSIYIFACQMLNAFIFGFVGYRTNRTVHDTIWYLPQPANEAGASAVIYPLRFFLLTTVMIPVSFKFVVDVCKYYMANAVEWDAAMTHTQLRGHDAADGAAGPRVGALERLLGASDFESVGCKVKNSSILEDLGQVDYVLSDKTGTLTQNVMELDSVSVCPGYHLPLAKLTDTCSSVPPDLALVDRATAQQHVRRFAQLVALCNTVEVVHPHPHFVAGTAQHASQMTEGSNYDTLSGAGAPSQVLYHAASPDEIALCNGMHKLGVSLVFRDEHHATLRMQPHDTETNPSPLPHKAAASPHSSPPAAFIPQEETWRIHHTFPFSSEKKSMGVLVEEPETERIWFVVKGADDRVLSMAAAPAGTSAAPPPPPLNADCAAKLALYAHRGLRTLLVGSKELSRTQLTSFLRAIEEANCLTEGRRARLDELRHQMETGVEILGITAIEDKLQDDVQETIGDMLLAGIKVWMLTGDKMETAEQIGLSCGLYHVGDTVIRIGDTGDRASRTDSPRPGMEEWRHKLLTFPVDRMPAAAAVSPFSGAPRRRGGSAANANAAASRACGRELEKRVLHFDPNDVAQLSNAPLRSLRHVEEEHEDGETGYESSLRRVDCVPTYGFATSGVAVPVERSTQPMRNAVLIVQGGAVLESILEDPTLRQRFTAISSRCGSVICARTTPSQKAAITQFVRQGGFMTLSVGDGGNDVAMIQEAHVGVGIAGKEGQQAARAADFSITQFSDLRALLFVHGQQAYVRTAYVIKYSFYKSMLISFIQLAYNVVGTHASGGTFWNSFSLTMWNGFYTLPQTIFYCLDRCAPRVVLERNPYLYKMTRHAVDIQPVEFFVSFVLRGVAQSIVLLWLSTQIYGPDFAYADTGGAASNDVTFSVAYTALMLSQLATVWWESHSVTPLNLVMLLGMPLFYLFSTSVYSDRPVLQYYGVFRKSLDHIGLLAAVGVAAVLVAPSMLYFTVLTVRHPNPRDVLRRAEGKRQRRVLETSKDYHRAQSAWVRWFGATPEAPSIMCGSSYAFQYAEGTDRSSLI